MAFLFNQRSRNRSPSELLRLARDLMLRLDGFGNPKVEDELSRILNQLRQIINCQTNAELSDESNCDLVSTAIEDGLPLLMAKTLARLPFETRKDAVVVLSHILRYRPPNTDPQAEPWALHNILYGAPESIIALVHSYKDTRVEDVNEGPARTGEAVTPSCGLVLREVIRYEAATSAILHDEPDAEWIYGPGRHRGVQNLDKKQVQSGRGVFWHFFDWIDGTGAAFELSTDAFSTFKELLTRHKDLVSRYLQVNYQLFFGKYNTLIMSPNYVTKRQAIKLLGEILLDRENYRVMTKYVEDPDNLKRCMLLLREPRRMVAYEGFHVFKIFAASPTKSPPVLAILIKNKARLLNFLPTFLEDRTDDDQFTDEKAYLLRIIKALPDTVPPADPVVSPTSPVNGQWPHGVGSVDAT